MQSRIHEHVSVLFYTISLGGGAKLLPPHIRIVSDDIKKYKHIYFAPAGGKIYRCVFAYANDKTKLFAPYGGKKVYA